MCYCSCSAFRRARGKSQPLLTPLLSCRPALKFFFSPLFLFSHLHTLTHPIQLLSSHGFCWHPGSHLQEYMAHTEAVWKIYWVHVVLLRCCLVKLCLHGTIWRQKASPSSWHKCILYDFWDSLVVSTGKANSLTCWFLILSFSFTGDLLWWTDPQSTEWLHVPPLPMKWRAVYACCLCPCSCVIPAAPQQPLIRTSDLVLEQNHNHLLLILPLS